ncbi:MAG: M20/M25/M40 family metallo-hydrolase, partial [bacterium]
AAYALPGELVVVSDKEVRPDEAAGFYYLGTCAAGYLYNGSSAAVGRAAPFRVLDRDAQAKDYYIVWAPGRVGVAPEDFEHLGAAVRLSEYEILVGLERGLGPGALRAVEHRIELIKLEPVTPVDWRYDGEAPPKKKDPRIEGPIDSITAEEYAGYIKQLQDFKSRYTDTGGFDRARDYVLGFFVRQNLETSLFPFPFRKLARFHYPRRGYMIADSNDGSIKRSRDYGFTWETIMPVAIDANKCSFWLDGDNGFVTGTNGLMARTVNGGITWNVKRFGKRGEEKYWTTCVYFVTADTGWIAGRIYIDRMSSGDFLKRTDDGGLTWTDQELPPGFCPRIMSFYDPQRGWAVGSAKAFYTGNGGSTWRRVKPDFLVVDIEAVGPKEAWAAIQSPSLLHTTDGVNWKKVDPGFAADFNHVEFLGSRRGYAAGGTLLKTKDGGVTWREVRNAPRAPLTFLSFADKLRGAVGSGEGIFRTDDGGASFVNITDKIDFDGENVIGERRGNVAPEEIVIIGGHLDSVAPGSQFNAPGAEDNASGTACAMAAARAFRNMSFKRTVRYLAFGGEERGLLGSKAYANYCAEKGEKIVAVLNADMVCYDEDAGARDDYTITYDGSDWLFNYVKRVGILYGNRLIYEAGQSGSDHTSFWSVGYDAIGGREGGIGAGEGFDYPYYHTTEDTLDKLHPALGVRFVRDYAAMLAHLAGVGDYLFEPEPPGKAVTPFSRPFAVYPNPYSF